MSRVWYNRALGCACASRGLYSVPSWGVVDGRSWPVIDCGMAVSNARFASIAGCSESMASRLRNGHRLPSAALRDRITLEFGLEPGEVIKAFASPEAFGSFLREHVFGGSTNDDQDS